MLTASPAGLERLLRLFQSFFLILTSYPKLIANLLPNSPVSVHVSAETSLRQLQGRLNISRRWMRLFRFLEAFRGGWILYMSPNKTLEVWMDAHAKTCFGMFGMLESITLLDLLDVDHLEVFGFDRAVDINIEAQKFWFVALYLSSMGSGIRLIRLLANRSPPPEVTDGSADEKPEAEKSELLRKRQLREKAWQRKVNAEMASLGLKMLSDVLDLVIPAATVGWVDVEPGMVGVAMFITSIITGLGVWNACGRKLEPRV